MNRRNLFKSLASLAVGVVAAPLAALIPKKLDTWEGTNIQREAKKEFLKTFPKIAEAYLNPELIALLAAQQKTINHEEILRALKEALQS